ncbi:MAG: hypothetical protein Q7S53_05450 [bacterium]|nr:hypothetical protein [bacterium]
MSQDAKTLQVVDGTSEQFQKSLEDIMLVLDQTIAGRRSITVTDFQGKDEAYHVVLKRNRFELVTLKGETARIKASIIKELDSDFLCSVVGSLVESSNSLLMAEDIGRIKVLIDLFESLDNTRWVYEFDVDRVLIRHTSQETCSADRSIGTMFTSRPGIEIFYRALENFTERATGKKKELEDSIAAQSDDVAILSSDIEEAQGILGVLMERREWRPSSSEGEFDAPDTSPDEDIPF